MLQLSKACLLLHFQHLECLLAIYISSVLSILVVPVRHAPTHRVCIDFLGKVCRQMFLKFLCCLDSEQKCVQMKCALFAIFATLFIGTITAALQTENLSTIPKHRHSHIAFTCHVLFYVACPYAKGGQQIK